MAYYTDGLTVLEILPNGTGVLLRASTTYITKVVQVYAAGALSGFASPNSGTVEFDLPDARPTDTFFLLTVDVADAETDYFDDAYPLASANGNRITVNVPQLRGQYPGTVLKIYRSSAGGATADLLAHTATYYQSFVEAGGFGQVFGTAFGYGPSAGFGFGFGSDFGFGSRVITWSTETLPPGVYKVRVVVEDQYGNASTEAADTVTLTTYPRPATSLVVSSYTKGTDTLVLGWTASPDIT